MSFGLYLSFTLLLFLAFAMWIRGLVVRRLRPDRILSDLNTEIRTLIAEINQAGDRNISLMEDRITRLSELIVRSDRQIDDARMMLEYLDSRGAGAKPADAEERGAPGNGAGPAAQAPAAPEPGPPEPSPPAPDKPEPDSPDRDTRDTVLTLHRQGLSQELIAARTGVAIGEVELIISLRGQRTWR
ncbi:MAG: hypothetical protein EA427_10565 [Spirochaetaceae bacterium]|nr:MAG: hypothetical protein EA427_10565 [Spirochaetaceae bacterium]